MNLGLHTNDRSGSQLPYSAGAEKDLAGTVGKFPNDTSVAEIRSRYTAHGYELLAPDDVLRLSGQNLTRIAVGVTSILDEVYRRSLDLSEERISQLVDAVVSGHTLLFVLLDSDRMVVATTAFTQVEQIVPGSRVSSYEAGRAAKRLGAPPRLAAGLFRASFLWAAVNLPGIDYLVAHARVACAEIGRPYNGGMLGRLLGHQFIPAHAVYSHYVAQTAAEPFVWACAPVNRESWRQSVRQQRICLPDDGVAKTLGAMLEESFDLQVAYTGPRLDHPPGLHFEIRELTGPSPAIESLYVLTDRPMPSRKTLTRIPGITSTNGALASGGLSDRIIVEEDIVSRADSAQTLALLRQQGFDLAGWTPSSLRYGRIALVLTRPGTVPAESISVAPADLLALNRLPAAERFLAHVLSRQPLPTVRSCHVFEPQN
jgi:hypothetical protein